MPTKGLAGTLDNPPLTTSNSRSPHSHHVQPVLFSKTTGPRHTNVSSSGMQVVDYVKDCLDDEFVMVVRLFGRRICIMVVSLVTRLHNGKPLPFDWSTFKMKRNSTAPLSLDMWAKNKKKYLWKTLVMMSPHHDWRRMLRGGRPDGIEKMRMKNSSHIPYLSKCEWERLTMYVKKPNSEIYVWNFIILWIDNLHFWNQDKKLCISKHCGRRLAAFLKLLKQKYDETTRQLHTHWSKENCNREEWQKRVFCWSLLKNLRER